MQKSCYNANANPPLEQKHHYTTQDNTGRVMSTRNVMAIKKLKSLTSQEKLPRCKTQFSISIRKFLVWHFKVKNRILSSLFWNWDSPLDCNSSVLRLFWRLSLSTFLSPFLGAFLPTFYKDFCGIFGDVCQFEWVSSVFQQQAKIAVFVILTVFAH